MNAKHHFLLGMLVGWLYISLKGCKIWPLLCGPLSRGQTLNALTQGLGLFAISSKGLPHKVTL